MSTKKGKAKPKGELIDCPACEGKGFVRVFSFKEIQDAKFWNQGKLRGTIDLNGKRFKVFLMLEEG